MLGAPVTAIVAWIGRNSCAFACLPRTACATIVARRQPCGPNLVRYMHSLRGMRRLWIGLVVVLAVSFAVLGFVGSRIYQLAPPIPDRVVTTQGAVIFDAGEVSAGQDVWRSFGGMELGSIWGHGAYVAPDWTADWLHRELVSLLDTWSGAEHGMRYENLPSEVQASLRERLTRRYRTNTYNAESRTITVSPERG
jgi:nitric oxide reductase subunit B